MHHYEEWYWLKVKYSSLNSEDIQATDLELASLIGSNALYSFRNRVLNAYMKERSIHTLEPDSRGQLTVIENDNITGVSIREIEAQLETLASAFAQFATPAGPSPAYTLERENKNQILRTAHNF